MWFLYYPTVFLDILSAISSAEKIGKRSASLCIVSKYNSKQGFWPFPSLSSGETCWIYAHFWAVSMWYCLKSKKGQMGCILVRAQVYLFFILYIDHFLIQKKVHHLYLVCVCNVLCHIFHRRPLVRKILKILRMTWIRLRVWNPAYARYYPGHWGGMDFWDIMRGGIVRR